MEFLLLVKNLVRQDVFFGVESWSGALEWSIGVEWSQILTWQK